MFRWLAAIAIAAAVAVFWAATTDPCGEPEIGIGRYSLEQLVLNAAVSYLALLACYLILGYPTWKRRAARVILNLAAIGFAWLLIELPAALGLVDYAMILFPRTTHGNDPYYMQRDPELLFRHRASSRYVGRQPWDPSNGRNVADGGQCEVEFRYDKNGFRNPRDFQRAPIVVIGDSFIEGYLVPYQQICSTRLSRILNLDVCNLGQVGYGPPQELVVLRRYGLGLRPRVVVWFFYGSNDLFDIEAYETIIHGWRRHLVRVDSFTSRSACLNALEGLGYWMGQLRQRTSPPEQIPPVRLRPEIAEGVTMNLRGVQCELAPDQRDRLMTKAENILQEARSTCRRNRMEFLVVLVPTRFRVYRELCVIPPGSVLAEQEPGDVPERLGRWCASAGIPYLDLTAALQSAARQGELVYFANDGHWCRKGHAVAADEVARFLREAGWLEAERAGRHRTAVPGNPIR